MGIEYYYVKKLLLLQIFTNTKCLEELGWANLNFEPPVLKSEIQHASTKRGQIKKLALKKQACRDVHMTHRDHLAVRKWGVKGHQNL